MAKSCGSKPKSSTTGKKKASGSKITGPMPRGQKPTRKPA